MKLYLINTIRTNNFNDDQIMEKIKAMWGEASRELENHRNPIYGVYYNYESNYKGDYSLSVAIEDEHENSSFIEIPDNETYEIYKVDTSDEQGIIKAWGKIWEQEESGSLKRAYSYDFEKYYPAGEIEIHIAVIT